MKPIIQRRQFLKQAGLALGALSTGPLLGAAKAPLFEISLAEWSLHKALFAGKMDHLNYARVAKSEFGIHAVEYVNQFFKDKATDANYLKEMRTRAEGEGVRSLLIMIDGEGNPSLHLRVFVTGGGCSGFQYGFSFDDESQEDDTEIVKDGVKVVVDGMSYQYLVGSTVDYSESLTGSQFVVENPNATSTCGCGASFSL